MRKIYPLNMGWAFGPAGSDENENQGHSKCLEAVCLPHTWNINENSHRGRYLYEKEIVIPEIHKEDVLYVEFLGANSVCEVYLNDAYVGEHRGGYATFRFNLTDFYRWGGDNRLKVYVDNSKTEDVSPLNGDFTIYGGLYREVNLICTSRTHFDLDYWGSRGIILQSEVNEEGKGSLHIELHTVVEQDAKVSLKVLDQKGETVQSMKVEHENKHLTMEILNPILWNGKDNPYLYTLKAALEDDTHIYDEVTMTFGFRSCEMSSEEGFFLNGRPLRINGVAKHQDFEGYGNALTMSQIRKDFELIREIGANALRLSHYQHDQSVYDRCDEEGYVVWAEIPMMSMPNSESVLKNASDQLKELIYQNCHHPSICFWGIQNEIAMGGESMDMYRSVDVLNDRVHELLPQGISASANMYHVKNSSPLNFITDMTGYNLYYGWYYDKIEDLSGWIDEFHLENPQVALGISEYGADANLAFHSEHPKVKDYSEEFQSVYHEETYGIIQSKPYLWGSFVWNMFDFGSVIRDEGGTKGKNAKGLVTFDRNLRKDAFYFYKANWSLEPFIHICGKRFVHRDKDKIDIRIYSSLSKISLSVNGRHVGEAEGEHVFLFKDVLLKPGHNVVRAYHDEYEDQATFMKADQPDASYIFVDPHPEINVKNWFTQEQGEIDLFPENYYSVMDSLGLLMENEEAWTVVKECAPKIAERAIPGGVTLLWVCNKMKSVLTEEEVKAMNNRLNKIEKVKN